jgi:hypothetical protein
MLTSCLIRCKSTRISESKSLANDPMGNYILLILILILILMDARRPSHGFPLGRRPHGSAEAHPPNPHERMCRLRPISSGGFALFADRGRREVVASHPFPITAVAAWICYGHVSAFAGQPSAKHRHFKPSASDGSDPVGVF